MTHEIKYSLLSSMDNIRIIKDCNFKDKTVKNDSMSEFIDINSFKNKNRKNSLMIGYL